MLHKYNNFQIKMKIIRNKRSFNLISQKMEQLKCLKIKNKNNHFKAHQNNKIKS
jgi:hypothetical protein